MSKSKWPHRMGRDRMMTLGVVHATRQGAAHLKDGTSNQDSVVVGMPSLGRLGSAAVMAVLKVNRNERRLAESYRTKGSHV